MKKIFNELWLPLKNIVISLDTFSLIYKKAIVASIEASKVIMDFYEKGFQSDYKMDGSPITEADLAASKIISDHLKHTNIPILGEEAEHQSYDIRKKWELNWCVDPLDGTKEFIKRNGEFAVNIALIKNNNSIFGIIACPIEKVVLFGGKGIGVYISEFDSIDETAKWIKIEKKVTTNKPLVIAISHSKDSGACIEFISKLKDKYSEIDYLKKGSALKFFDLAKGIADIYPRFAPTMEWDIAAGQAIIEELGGTVCSIDSGKKLQYNKEDLFNPHFIVLTNPMIK